jgi:hypothetical protein
VRRLWRLWRLLFVVLLLFVVIGLLLIVLFLGRRCITLLLMLLHCLQISFKIVKKRV